MAKTKTKTNGSPDTHEAPKPPAPQNDINQVVLGGVVADAPKLSEFGDNSVVKFRLASKETFQSRSTGDNQVRKNHVRVSAWNGLARKLHETLKKGDRLVLQGVIREDTWTDADGNERSTLGLVIFREPTMCGRDDSPATDGDEPPVEALVKAATDGQSDDDIAF